jgi:hypothetical protein
MTSSITQLRLTVAGGDASDLEEIAELARQLQEELLDLDVIRVDPVEVTMPSGSKSGEAMSVGAFVIGLQRLPMRLPGGIPERPSRHPGGQSCRRRRSGWRTTPPPAAQATRTPGERGGTSSPGSRLVVSAPAARGRLRDRERCKRLTDLGHRDHPV